MQGSAFYVIDKWRLGPLLLNVIVHFEFLIQENSHHTYNI